MEDYKGATLVDWVENSIIKDIRDNKLSKGAEIPNELELAEKFDVGRNVIRESLSRLRMLGIIESRKRRGMVVAQPNVMAAFHKVVNPHMLSRETIIDLLGMRVSLEIGSAPMIINNVTDEDIAALKKIVAQERVTKKSKVDIEAEKAFHFKVYEISKNKAMLDFLSLLLPVFTFVYENFSDFDRFNKGKKEGQRIVRHKDLVGYLEARDLPGYQKAMEDHLIAYIDFINYWNNQESEK
ncbi:FadR/GntR family transcriptional regulator [Parapedobacter indicus]|nr:GntR family transcriptional regulator [Parapedobacter indicus]